MTRLPCIARAGLILLALTLVVPALAPVYAFTNGQAASLVLGQSDFTSNGTATTASGMKFPTGVAVDPTSGKVFVADMSSSRVLRFASITALMNGAAAESVLGQSDFTSNIGALTASGMLAPQGVAVDSVGTLWVADTNHNRMLRFDSAATKANGAAADGVLGQPDFTNGVNTATASGMSFPQGVAVDGVGTLWVADTNNNRVLRFDGARTKVNGAAADSVLGQSDFTSNSFATTASGMATPSSVAVDNDGTLWVADTFNNRLLRFDSAATKANGAAADGVLGQSDFTSRLFVTTASGMNSPEGITMDSIGRLWVADTNNNRVLRFDSAVMRANGAAADGVLGQSDFTSSGAATTAGGMAFPQDVALDSDGTLWVADTNNARVLHFDKPVQTITFAALADKTSSDPPFVVSATGGASGQSVTFTSATVAVCTVSGNTVTLVSIGTCTIVATQAGDYNYRPASPISRSFTVTFPVRVRVPLVMR